MTAKPCPFCNPPADEIIREYDDVLVVRDIYPVSPGHCLIVPRFHVTSLLGLFALQKAVWWAIADVTMMLDAERSPDGYNIGVNMGEAAGQTVGHMHIHVIPRYTGDVEDAFGGVRGVIP